MSSKKRPQDGVRYGNLTILHVHKKTGKAAPIADCQCDCGRIISVSVQSLRASKLNNCHHADCEYRRQELIDKEFNYTPAIVVRLKPKFYCGRTEDACVLSAECHICCAECDKGKCTMRCMNNPENCGAKRREDS